VLSSVTRIARLEEAQLELGVVPRHEWDTGDYVIGQVSGVSGPLRYVELANGRMAEVDRGDLIVGAFGKRAATLEACGSWEAIGDDLRMHALTSAGLFGAATSKSPYVPALMELEYRGHVLTGGLKRTMLGSVPARPARAFDLPVILVIGTSMSAGKTTSCRVVVRELKSAGLRVAGAKLTGAARYRDTLAMADAGADAVFDFVDVGLSSTICEPEVYRAALGTLLGRIAASGVEALVAEAGASPLEPYNGMTAIEVLRPHLRCTILCASDPYAVTGVMTAFDRAPDLVAGGAANTEAGVDLVARLTGLRALNLHEEVAMPSLRALLRERLGLEGRLP
jgi:hypothetical protein